MIALGVAEDDLAVRPPSQTISAPNLTSNIWLYGGDEATVYQTIFNARAGVMPYWKGRLDDNTIRQLTVYVHSLGGGEKSEPKVESTQNATEQPAAEPTPGTVPGN